MIIEIKEGIEFDTDKTFDEQNFECQQYFYDIMNSSTANIVYDSFNRPFVETWELTDKPIKDYCIERISVYQKQEPDWHLQSQTIKIVEL